MSGLSYKDAGVDIATGNALIERIKPHIKRTLRKEVMSELGGFGGMMSIPEGYRQPILVSGTDGVGTKLRLAIDAGIYDTIGIDLVAMCVNDIIVAGAEPFMFLDYYATGKLDNDVAEAVVKGIADGCVMSGASLVGGETAEMPGMYQANDFDLAGFAVGVVEKAEVVTGETVQAGQRLIGVASSGPHSNGYSLIRKVIEHSGVQLDDDFDGRTYAQALLTPTTIYVKAMLDCLKLDGVHALAHITGGGLTENLPRVLPANTQAVVERSSWQLPGIFQWLQQAGGIADEEMLLTFNCGVGMVMVVDEAAESSIIECLSKHDLEAFPLGSIEASSETQPSVSYR